MAYSVFSLVDSALHILYSVFCLVDSALCILYGGGLVQLHFPPNPSPAVSPSSVHPWLRAGLELQEYSWSIVVPLLVVSYNNSLGNVLRQ